MACDVNAMATDHMWQSFEDARRAKSYIGTALLASGAGVAVYGASRDNRDAELAGLPPAAEVAPAWQPGDRHVLAYVTARGRVTVLSPDEGAVAWVSRAHPKPRALVWSPDGKTLVLATARKLVSFDARSGRAHTFALSGTRAAAFSPQGRLAVVRGTTVLLVEGGRTRRLFAAPARLAGLAWSPNGRWLLTTLPAADQWIFVSGARVLAVSHIARQFGGVPALDGWRPGA